MEDKEMNTMKELNLNEMELVNGGNLIDEAEDFLKKIFLPKPLIPTPEIPKTIARLGRK